MERVGRLLISAVIVIAVLLVGIWLISPKKICIQQTGGFGKPNANGTCNPCSADYTYDATKQMPCSKGTAVFPANHITPSCEVPAPIFQIAGRCMLDPLIVKRFIWS
jgi:hypothetical protein